MTHDYGFRTKAKLKGSARTAVIVGAVVVLLVGGGAVWFALKTGWDAEARNYTDYFASGQPCPASTPARHAVEGPQFHQSFEYGDMTLIRASGEADCADVRDSSGSFPVCRFSSPGALEVKAGGQDLVFATGIGKSAAIMRRKGQVSCVITERAMSFRSGG
ncbi:MAG TPA: hypothetical protein VG939_13830 [Caulobacteraceae bacterium]|nr:hypothetical protein [Caulobacteraceae bacterium]